MPTILDGKSLADKICADLKTRCDYLKNKDIFPRFTIVTSGNDSASKVYVHNKTKRCNEIGIECDIRHFDELTPLALSSVLMNADNPIIVQEPITGEINHEDVMTLLGMWNDADGFSESNFGRLAAGYKPHFAPCTPSGVMRLLREYNVLLEGQNALVIGRSNIVGRPMAMMLEQAGCTVTVAHSKTKQEDLESHFWDSNIVVSCVGKPDVIPRDVLARNLEWLKNKTIIDVGIIRGLDGKLRGDIPEEIKQHCQYYTPVPGGVGPMTVVMLMENVINHYAREP